MFFSVFLHSITTHCC